MGILNAALNTLDLVPSFGRDLAAGAITGDWDTYNPIDQFSSPFSEDNRNARSGRDILELAGVEDPGFLPGFAVDVATDPFTWAGLGAGAGAGIMKAARAMRAPSAVSAEYTSALNRALEAHKAAEALNRSAPHSAMRAFVTRKSKRPLLDRPSSLLQHRPRRGALGPRSKEVNYLSIGHNSPGSEMWIFKGNRFKKEKVPDTGFAEHTTVFDDFHEASAAGRIDHEAKKISIQTGFAGGGVERAEKAMRELAKQYPEYDIYVFPGGPEGAVLFPGAKGGSESTAFNIINRDKRFADIPESESYQKMPKNAAKRRRKKAEKARAIFTGELLEPTGQSFRSPGNPLEAYDSEFLDYGSDLHQDYLEAVERGSVLPAERLALYYGPRNFSKVVNAAQRAMDTRNTESMLKHFPRQQDITKSLYKPVKIQEVSSLPDNYGGAFDGSILLNENISRKGTNLIRPSLVMDHEMTHALQGAPSKYKQTSMRVPLWRVFDIGGMNIGGDSELINRLKKHLNYSTTPIEIDPSLAEAKRLYSLIKGKPVLNLEDAAKALDWGSNQYGTIANNANNINRLAKEPYARELMKRRMLELLSISPIMYAGSQLNSDEGYSKAGG